MIAPLFFLLALGGLMHAVRSFRGGAEAADASGAALAFGFLLLAAFFAGRAFARFGLPRLTGYIACGIVVGPSVLGLLTHSMVDSLSPFKGAAVCLIALSAGGELNFARLRPLLPSIRSIVLWTAALSLVLGAATLIALRPLIPFLATLSWTHAIAASLPIAVAISAKSPAVVMAIFAELSPEGPVSRTMIGSVVVADLLAIVLFAVTSSIAQTVIGGRLDIGSAALQVIWQLFGSIAMGILIGVVLTVYLRRVHRERGLFVLFLCVVVSEVLGRLALDPLIVMLAAGVFIENVTEIEASKLVRDIESASLPVYIVFFAIAGAMLHLDVLATVAVPAVVLVLVRAASMWLGTRIGAHRAGAEPAVRTWAFAGLLPQAGLALALALLLPRAFPEFGEAAGALVVGIVALNELIMPVVLRNALFKAGEAAEPEQGKARADAPAH